MNSKLVTNAVNKVLLAAMMVLGIFTFAQDNAPSTDITTTTTTTTETWYSNPVYWVIGGLLFIILIVALMRGGKRD